MCIRDSHYTAQVVRQDDLVDEEFRTILRYLITYMMEDPRTCLLYTSDAADERSSVDLGGRRIIKKKKKIYSEHNEMNNKKTS